MEQALDFFFQARRACEEHGDFTAAAVETLNFLALFPSKLEPIVVSMEQALEFFYIFFRPVARAKNAATSLRRQRRYVLRWCC